MGTVVYRSIPFEEAKQRVSDSIKEKPGIWLSEIIDELRLSPALVVRCVSELREEGSIGVDRLGEVST